MGQRNSTYGGQGLTESVDPEQAYRYPYYYPIFPPFFPPHLINRPFIQPFPPSFSDFPASVSGTPGVQNVPKKADNCKPCAADDGQEREGTEKLTTAGKTGGKGSPVREKDAAKQRSANVEKRRTPDQQPQIQRAARRQTYVPSGGPQTYVPSGGPQTYVPSGGPQTYVPSGGPQTYVPSGGPEMYVPSERLVRYYSESESSDSESDYDDDYEDDDDDDDEDDDEDEKRHKNIVRKVIIIAGAPCYPASSVGGRSLPSKISNRRRFRATPAQMIPYHCPVSSQFYQQRFSDCNQGKTCPAFHRFPANYDSSFGIPNTYLTPVLCPSSNLNFGSGNTRTRAVDTGQKNLAFDAEGLCETIRGLSDILDPEDDKILKEVMQQLTSGSTNNSKKFDCGGKCNRRE